MRVERAQMQLHVASDANANPLRAVRPVGLQQPLAIQYARAVWPLLSVIIIKASGDLCRVT